jgi:pimeloyl-ACP methyl ester carboxylesterase
MTNHVISADGTRIAFDRLGAGPPLIVIGGILCDRETTRPLAEHLSAYFTVINFDRRGRGESGITALLPDGHHTLLKDADHAAPPELVAPAVTAFLT